MISKILGLSKRIFEINDLLLRSFKYENKNDSCNATIDVNDELDTQESINLYKLKMINFDKKDTRQIKKISQNIYFYIHHTVYLSDQNVLIKLKNINIIGRSQSKLLIKDLSFNFTRGMKLLISGPSGVGKSTLMKMILGYSSDDLSEKFSNYFNSTVEVFCQKEAMFTIPQKSFVFKV